MHTVLSGAARTAVLTISATLGTALLAPAAGAQDVHVGQHEMVEIEGMNARERGRGHRFKAFGKHFELELEDNARLVRDLPRADRARLLEGTQLLRGRVAGDADSWVRLTRSRDGVTGAVWHRGELYMVDSGARFGRAGKIAVYRMSDVSFGNATCGMGGSHAALDDYDGLVEELSERALQAAGATQRLDVAIVADSQFVNANANAEAAAMARMNVVDGIFSEQVGIQINVVEVRTLSNNGSLSSSSASTLLNQFGAYTTSNGFSNPGLAHLITGRNLNGSTVGIAWLNSLCESRFGTGVSQVSNSGPTGALIIAHEMGHNFGAQHDNQGGSACGAGFIMNPSINGSDRFSSCSLSSMNASIARASCLAEPTGPDNTAADVRVNAASNSLTANVDQPFQLSFEVRNAGNAVARSPQVQVDFESGLRPTGATAQGGNCSVAGVSVVECSFSDMSPSNTRSVSVTAVGDSAGTFDAEIEASANNDTNPGNNSATVAVTVNAPGVERTVLSANFNASAQGFAFVKNAFGTTAPGRYSFGLYRPLGVNRVPGSLATRVGGTDNADVLNMSGGWRRTFSLDRAGRVTVRLRYRMTQHPSTEGDEYGDALCAIDGNLVSQTSNDYINRIRGDSNNPRWPVIGWSNIIEIDAGQLQAGSHTITLGGFANKKTAQSESTYIHFDDLEISVR